MKPVIGITMGDAAGIGPEIIIKVLNKVDIYSLCHPLVIGDEGVLKAALDIVGINLKIQIIDNIKDSQYEYGAINLVDLKNIRSDKIIHGKVNAEYGKAAGEYIEKAVELAKRKEIDAIVTAPINKESFDLGGYGKKYRGHTEMLASLTNSDEVAMLLISGNLRVIHVTTHLSMRQALELIKKEKIYKTIRFANLACSQLGIMSPKIAVAGLNPHCGDGGIMGQEEITEIIPAIEKALADGLDVFGPVPADTIFSKGKSGAFDIIVAMYHDQGHIPVKLMGFEWTESSWSAIRGVNISIGLPIIRTSVDHGTAFGKAGNGKADETSLIDAIDYAVRMSTYKERGDLVE